MHAHTHNLLVKIERKEEILHSVDGYVGYYTIYTNSSKD